MQPLPVVVIAGLVLAFALIERRTARGPITGPLVFTGAGLLLAGRAADALPPVPEEALHVLAEGTLALILFADATRIDLGALRRELGLPARLLLIGMPLTVLAGWGVGALLLPGWDAWSLLVLAAILTPTDAALGQAVVSADGVPQRIRQALNVESGLNDGIAVPLVTLATAMAAAGAGLSAGHAHQDSWLAFVAAQLGLGPLVGIIVGGGGGWLLTRARAAGWSSEPSQRLGGLALPALAWAGAGLVGGNGFIAAFVGGLVLGASARDICEPVHAFLESEGELLMLLVFLAMGVTLGWTALGLHGWAPWIYALASLTVIRMLPVALSLIGAGLRPGAVGFVAWFGPRGLATVVFAIQLREVDLPHGDAITGIALLTVLGSVLAHGVSAGPAARFYGARTGDMAGDHPEMREVTAHRLRRPRPGP